MTKKEESRRNERSLLTFNCRLRLAVTKELVAFVVMMALLVLNLLLLWNPL